MSERKVINKYYPPDFDPSQITKKKKKVKTGANSLPTVRLMTPFSLKCTNCNEYISKSRKFNARKEVTDQTYLGMKIIRFHIKCPRCASEIIFRTDYKTSDYILEFGAQRNYDKSVATEQKEETLEETLARLEREEKEERAQKLKEESKKTTVEELEAKLDEIRKQQDMHEELEELKERNIRLEAAKKQLHTKAIIEDEEEDELNSEDERLAEEAFSKAKLPTPSTEPIHKPQPAQPIHKIVKKKKKVSKLGIKLK